MLKLIVSEFKKIWKNKLNIFLIVLAIIGTMSFAYLKYIEYDDSQVSQTQYANFDGEVLKGVEVVQFIDQVIHQYKGNWNHNISQKLEQEYLGLLKKYSSVNIDNEAMETHYGEHYQELLDKVNDGTVTEKYINDYFEKYSIDYNNLKFIDDNSEEGPDYTINIYYKNSDILNSIGKAFFNRPLSMYKNLESAFKEDNQYQTMQDVIIKKQLEKPSEFDLEVLGIRGLDAQDNEVYYQYLESQLQDISTTFDSSLPNEMIDLTLSSTLWIGILAIMIVIANTYGIEKQYRMEQLIYCTQKGKFKVVVAKVLMVVIFSLLMMGLVIGGCFIISWIVLPVHTFDMAIFSERVGLCVFTWKQYFIYMFILAMLAGLATGLLTMLLSYLTKNRFITIIAIFVFTVSGFWLSQSRMLPDTILALLPYNMAVYGGYFLTPQFGFPYIITGNQVIVLRDLAVTLWPVFCIIICSGVILHARYKKTLE